MKNIKLSFLVLFLSLLSTSCEDISLADVESGNNDKNTSIKIYTRTIDGAEVSYPLFVYAFAEGGQLQKYMEVKSEQESISLSLPKGTDYRVVVVSADPSIYKMPSSPSLNSVISLSAKSTGGNAGSEYTLSHPLMMGFADVNATQSSIANCNIQLQHQLTSLVITLQHVPSDCTEISVNVSSPYEGVSLSGIGQSNLSSAQIPLTLQNETAEGNVWASSEVYIFPTSAPQTTFTISYVRSGANQYSAVTYQSTLKAGTPYVLNGSFHDDSFHINANVISSVWEAPTTLSFEFGDGVNPTISADGTTSGEDHNDEDGTVYPVTAIPAVYSLWENHLVAAVLDDEGNMISADNVDEATLLLISKTDWDKQTSAFNQSVPAEAFDIASSYAESTLSGWRVPTEAEGRILFQSYNSFEEGESSPLAALVATASADPICIVDDKGEKVRYLCADAEKTYSFSVNSILNAGKTVKNYHLRLVRKVKVKRGV